MATAAQAQELVSRAACSACIIPPGMVPYTILEAVRNIGGSGATFRILLENGDNLAAETGDILRKE